jgi:hypothetical protein
MKSGRQEKNNKNNKKKALSRRRAFYATFAIQSWELKR